MRTTPGRARVGEHRANVPVFMIPYIDVRLVPSATGEINDATLQSFAASGVR